MEKIYKVIYTKLAKNGETQFCRSQLLRDKSEAIKQCEKYGQLMRNTDFVVSRNEESDYYIWMREYSDLDGVFCPTACYSYECIESGVLKTPHLSVHHDYFYFKTIC